jgi:hypothetical protein
MQLIFIEQLAVYATGTILINELAFWELKGQLAEEHTDRHAYLKRAAGQMFLLFSIMHVLTYMVVLRNFHRQLQFDRFSAQQLLLGYVFIFLMAAFQQFFSSYRFRTREGDLVEAQENPEMMAGYKNFILIRNYFRSFQALPLIIHTAIVINPPWQHFLY